MSIQYKFKSSVNFDTVEIGNRASISIGELRSRILRGVSQQQQGFDLVFSDAVSGLEYKGDDSQIPSGTSVIIKRIPGGTVPSAMLPIQEVKHVGLLESRNLNTVQNGPMDEFDVLGAGFCPTTDSNFSDFNQEFDQNNFQNNSKGNKKEEVTGLRSACQNPDSLEPDDAIPRGSNLHGNDGIILPRVYENLKLKRLPKSNVLAVQSTNFSNLPLELKCSLCNNFFKDAVMIPCCQHSFCEKCICQVLIEKGMCPKCFSIKCSVGDLLPNLSLQQAILHFLDSQMLDADLQNMQKDVPDGESGIQDKDVSCVLTVVQRELELPQSSCATGKGSNQVSMEEQQHWRNGGYWNSGLQSRKANQFDDLRCMYPHHNDMPKEIEDFAQSGDFQGENQPTLPQAKVHNDADLSVKGKGGFWKDSGGGGRNFSGPTGHKKVVRNCYACGSPDHLIRDCPVSHPNPTFQPGNGAFHGGMVGFASPYWSGPSMHPFTPYANMMYGNPTMMPFNASMVPVSPFSVPPYVPSMQGSLPSPRVNMRMENMGPPRSGHFGLQQCEYKRKHSNENIERERHPENKDDTSDRYLCDSQQKSHDYLSQKDEEASPSRSDDSFSQRLGRKQLHDKHMHSDARYAEERHEQSYRTSSSGRDKRLCHGERPKDASRSPDRHGEGRHRHHHGEFKKCDERRGHYDSDTSLGRRLYQKDARRRVESDAQVSHRNYHRSWESERKGGYKEGDAGQDSSRHHAKQSREKRRDDGWQVISGSDDDRREEYHRHKRRAH